MRVLQNRYTNSDSQSYSGEFSTGWTSGALTGMNDSANTKSRVGSAFMHSSMGKQAMRVPHLHAAHCSMLALLTGRWESKLAAGWAHLLSCCRR